MPVLLALLVSAAIALALLLVLVVWLLSRSAERGKVIVQEVFIDPGADAPRKAGPPLWESNADFTEFVGALAREVDALVAGRDLERLASQAGISRAMLANLASGSNPQLQTLWKLCNSRRILLSQLFAQAENRL